MPRCSETEFILEPSHLAPRYTLFHIPCQQRWTHRAYLRERKWNERNPENFIVTYTPSTPKSNSNFSTILVVRWITAVNYDFEEEEGTDTWHQSFPELLYSVKGGGDFYRAFYRQDITLIANDFVVQLINYCTLLCSRGRKLTFRFERESVGSSRLNWIASFGRESFGGEKSGELLERWEKGGKDRAGSMSGKGSRGNNGVGETIGRFR